MRPGPGARTRGARRACRGARRAPLALPRMRRLCRVSARRTCDAQRDEHSDADIERRASRIGACPAACSVRSSVHVRGGRRRRADREPRVEQRDREPAGDLQHAAVRAARQPVGERAQRRFAARRLQMGERLQKPRFIVHGPARATATRVERMAGIAHQEAHQHVEMHEAVGAQAGRSQHVAPRLPAASRAVVGIGARLQPSANRGQHDPRRIDVARAGIGLGVGIGKRCAVQGGVREMHGGTSGIRCGARASGEPRVGVRRRGRQRAGPSHSRTCAARSGRRASLAGADGVPMYSKPMSRSSAPKPSASRIAGSYESAPVAQKPP
ncbi:hypothetical protein BURPS1710b_A2049 [Burkholderia pseudomallei 1710b]|uniref:Uncharacterized protein n=1 Tax=Burkholderia pseudomallei (strain 1710b) TaxID=320372 RepID=Q3JGV4_BURP1|nr:hypothetical protein BURPS1710b_A2049 [Burkholderia pseudomallei 1710b]